MKIFRLSLVVTVLCLGAAYLIAGTTGLLMAAILGILEVSLSFDNAIVNAAILEEMEEKWRRRFITWGMLIAVFGMRVIFPILIVAIAASINPLDVFDIAFNKPDEYAAHLLEAHITISSFGGMFLLLVFLSFLFDYERDVWWLGRIEEALARIGRLESAEIVFALLVLLGVTQFVHEEERYAALISGVSGITLFVLIDSLAKLIKNFEAEKAKGMVVKGGLMSFLYLEVLDASFSFDGVIGAFAISKNVAIITIGLTIGAMYVRSMTIYLVERKVLQQYIYLEHGAHYAIGILAFIMLLEMLMQVPDIITGLLGVVFISLSMFSSVRHNYRVLKEGTKES